VVSPVAWAKPPEKLTGTQKTLLQVAANLLDEAQVSYVYGGYQVGDPDACGTCNDCLVAKAPRPKERLAQCPVCRKCSLDCSHFTELVYRQAGLPYPYVATKGMLELDAATLRRNYGLVDLGTRLEQTTTGDLLVYDGHVVMLERRREPQPGQPEFRGDVIHATGGKDIKSPGEGIQRERFIDLARFRGPLRRILRHAQLAPSPSAPSRPERGAGARPQHPVGAGGVPPGFPPQDRPPPSGRGANVQKPR
jgi:hypothetical protein